MSLRGLKMGSKFVIARPMVGKSFRNTYNKQLEVYEYTEQDNVIHTYTMKKGKIVEIFPKNKRHIDSLVRSVYCKGLPVNEHCDYSGSTSSFLHFDSVELAMASKIYLLKNLRALYIERVREMEARIERNMPKDLDAAIAVLEVEYAEYFI